MEIFKRSGFFFPTVSFASHLFSYHFPQLVNISLRYIGLCFWKYAHHSDIENYQKAK